MVYARLKFLHVLAPVFRWIGEGMGNMDELVNWALHPLWFVVKLVFKLVASFIAPLIHKKQEPSAAKKMAYVSNPDDVEIETNEEPVVVLE